MEMKDWAKADERKLVCFFVGMVAVWKNYKRWFAGIIVKRHGVIKFMEQ